MVTRPAEPVPIELALVSAPVAPVPAAAPAHTYIVRVLVAEPAFDCHVFRVGIMYKHLDKLGVYFFLCKADTSFILVVVACST